MDKNQNPANRATLCLCDDQRPQVGLARWLMVCNPSFQEAEARETQVLAQPMEFDALVTSYLNIKKKKKIKKTLRM